MARRLGDVLEAILAGVVVIDRDGRVEDVNSTACRILEHSPDALQGRPVEELVHADHAVASLGRQVLASGIAFSAAQQTIERRSGADASVDVAASPLFDDSGTLDGAVLVLRDRSRLRKLEQLQAERDRFAAFGGIAAGLAHEIKNPLGGIRGAGELLARRAHDEKTRETAGLVVREADRIAALVDDFMVFARGDRLVLAPTNVHRVLDEVLQLLALDPLSKDKEVVRGYDPSIPDLLADAGRLHQVFLNLARNALQAMDDGPGTLRVRTRMTLDHRIAVGNGALVPTLAVWIEDTGCGMSPEELDQASTPFFTTRAGGTGLGLAVAEYWTSQHGGSLHIESTRGEGTRVRVTLPLRRKA